AIEYYSKAIQKDPAWFEAYFNMGLACYGSGEYSTSLLAFENALALKPDSWETRYNFALALNKADHPNEAIVELKKVTRLKDSYANAWLEMGVIYQNRFADIDNAYNAYQKFIALAPDHPSAYTTKIWLTQNASKVKAQP
ncbi:MAG: tetratricopeptide repeat protein, partial [Clostridia bacterium]|nr:tetratricopeptide repeat protein [Clostridia bacterium]